MAEHPQDFSRREFFHLLGTSAALAGLSGCAQEPEAKIVPYDRTPDGVTPDHPTYYATSMLLDGLATGLLVKSLNGRPIKVEGNPNHPASLGGTGIHHQASVLDLYDPERARGTLFKGEPRPFEDCISDFAMTLGRGDGLRILLEPTSSLLMGSALTRIRTKFPGARVHFHAPFSHANELAGIRRATGQVLQPRCAFDRAAVVVSLDSDFLNATTYPPRYARDFMDARRNPDAGMNRLYSIESTLSLTGATADNRFAVRPSEVQSAAAQLLAELGTGIQASQTFPWVKALARDLKAHAPRVAVIAGYSQPPEVHALTCAINAALKSDCVAYGPSPILEAGEPSHETASLFDDLRKGAVQHLIILEGNPVHTSFADTDLARLIENVPRSLYLGLYSNETSARCQWFVPAAHYLESWSDGRAYDGTVSFVQPLIRPLYGGKTAAELLAALAGDPNPRSHDLLRASWMAAQPEVAGAWEQNIQRGYVSGSAPDPVAPAIDWNAVRPIGSQASTRGEIEIQLTSSYTLHDGRFEHNDWLQELPDPMTRQSWGNSARLSPATAARLQITTGQHVRVVRGQRTLIAPAFVLPGQADDTVSIAVGHGGRDVGVDAYVLWTGDMPGGIGAGRVEPTDGSEALALEQVHREQEHRPIALSQTLKEHQNHPAVRPSDEHVFTLFPPFEQHGNQWGLAVDMSVCTGCASCVVACQAENNIPIVGKENVIIGRAMHWLRIDRYFEPTGVEMQPMLCQHCEKAPCEYVCPVYATTHSPDGLNEMTYNRCVGTRYCSNNCPYKVRRFNWFNFNAHQPPTLKMLHNPDVTVRGRGVMEKCTYCVQRIREAEIRAQREHRPIRDLEILTACQQACPTNVFVFGDIADSKTAVSKQLGMQRTYGVLEELGTQPRTRYLTRIRNPNPEIA